MSHIKSPSKTSIWRGIKGCFWWSLIIDLSLSRVALAHSNGCYSDKKTESSNYSYNTSRHRSRPFVSPASIHKNWFKARHDVPFGLASKNQKISENFWHINIFNVFFWLLNHRIIFFIRRNLNFRTVSTQNWVQLLPNTKLFTLKQINKFILIWLILICNPVGTFTVRVLLPWKNKACPLAFENKKSSQAKIIFQNYVVYIWGKLSSYVYLTKY